jgi:diguanylate cyclase (GGDEF)-like protein
MAHDPRPISDLAESPEALPASRSDRWRDLVHLAADFVFETDEWGRFTLAAPDPCLDWAVSGLLGQSASGLLAEAAGFNPFRVTAQVRRRQVVLRKRDGGTVSLAFSAAPIKDPAGCLIGVRGVGIRLPDAPVTPAEGTPRWAEALEQMLAGREIPAAAVLEILLNGLSADGAAVVASPDEGPPRAIHGAGARNAAAIEAAGQHLAKYATRHPEVTTNGKLLIVNLGEKMALAAWRSFDARAWDPGDIRLIGAAGGVIRMVLEHEAMQRDMTQKARTDPLTGLLNRGAFLEEFARHATLVDREHQPGTLMIAHLDHFATVNEAMGQAAGDEVLKRTADLLRKIFRPTDLIARLGGDEFAVWLNGADHMTAAERADFLRDAVPAELAELIGPDLPSVTVSIGIAGRNPEDGETIDTLMRRATAAMQEVKRSGGGHWRVALLRRL